MSGISYEDYVRSAIFGPLEMHRSAAALSEAAATGIASGYAYWLGWPVAFDTPYPRRAVPAGYLISSAEDMAHFVVAQLNDGTYGDRQLLSSQGIATLHAPGAKITVRTCPPTLCGRPSHACRCWSRCSSLSCGRPGRADRCGDGRAVGYPGAASAGGGDSICRSASK